MVGLTADAVHQTGDDVLTAVGPIDRSFVVAAVADPIDKAREEVAFALGCC